MRLDWICLKESFKKISNIKKKFSAIRSLRKLKMIAILKKFLKNLLIFF